MTLRNDTELKAEKLQRAKIFVLAGPQDRFTQDEFEVLKDFVNNGGSLWVLLGDGGEQEFNTNVNFFLEQYGIYINSGKCLKEEKIESSSLLSIHKWLVVYMFY